MAVAPRLRRLGAGSAGGAFDIDMPADATRGAYDMLGGALALEMLPEIMAPHVRKVDPG